MEIKTFNARGVVVNFVCESRNTRNGFAHDCTVFIYGHEFGRASCYYLNRTWECYRYQTVMLKTVRGLIDEYTAYIKNEFMRENNYKRMTPDRQKRFANICLSNDRLILYNELIEQIKTR